MKGPGDDAEAGPVSAADPDVLRAALLGSAAAGVDPEEALALLTGGGPLSESAPGPPPRPGLVWNDDTHRWRHPGTGEEHDGPGRPSEVAPAVAAHPPVRDAAAALDAARAALAADLPPREKAERVKAALAAAREGALAAFGKAAEAAVEDVARAAAIPPDRARKRLGRVAAALAKYVAARWDDARNEIRRTGRGPGTLSPPTVDGLASTLHDAISDAGLGRSQAAMAAVERHVLGAELDPRFRDDYAGSLADPEVRRRVLTYLRDLHVPVAAAGAGPAPPGPASQALSGTAPPG